MGDLSAEQRSRLAAREVDASLGRAELEPDIAHEQLRAVRLDAGLSCMSVSMKAECSRNTIRRYEQNEYRFPLITALKVLKRCGYRVIIEKRNGSTS